MSETILHLDPSRMAPPFRALHGVNNGPSSFDGLLDASPIFRQLRVPDVRLHDCQYPGRTVVDISAVFPDMSRDPENPASYDFGRTDLYLKQIADCGAEITYRLGYTIDHHPDRRYSRVPADFGMWAKVCVGIARHYCQRWAGGFDRLVKRFEIWNEPDQKNGPESATWQGSAEDYFRLYEITASSLKRQVPGVSVGGPAITSGAISNGFFEHFLAHCKDHSVPLDFASWHIYTDDPADVLAHAGAVRRMLDTYGFTRAKSHLTEWHYIPPGMDWGVIMKPVEAVQKRQMHLDVNGGRAAAFTAATLLLLQDGPVDMANFYTGDTMFYFGMLDPVGSPLKSCMTLQAVSDLVACPVRLALGDPLPSGLVASAGMLAKNQGIRVVLVNGTGEYRRVRLAGAKGGSGRIISDHLDAVAWAMDGESCLLPAWSVVSMDLLP